MLKYVDTAVTFAEVPDEITLCINISNCPCHCVGCHSSYLAQDIGNPLRDDLWKLIRYNKGISCVAFMGGDADPGEINNLAKIIRNSGLPIRVAWYSGRNELSPLIDIENFDYIKIGSYQEERGALNNPNTNQRFYQVVKQTGMGVNLHDRYVLSDITYRFCGKNQ